MFAEEDMKLREMELQAKRYDTSAKLVDDRSLEQRYQHAIQQLEHQKQRFYEDIERVIKFVPFPFMFSPLAICG